MENQDLQLGLLVRNPRCPEWGPGKVVHITGDVAHVMFRDDEDSRAKRFKADRLQVADSQTDAILENLPPLVTKNGDLQLRGKRLTVDQARRKFIDRYPLGFQDPAYLGDQKAGERNYKWRAHELWRETLDDGKAAQLLADGDIGELRTRAVKVAGAVNLLAVTEAIAFSEGLSDEDAAVGYFDALLRLLESGPAEAVFEDYSRAVAALPAKGATSTDKWTVATILPFLAAPDRFMFVKPTIIKKAAERLAFNLHYEAQPNWNTYSAVLRMSDTFMELLSDLAPRDFIDIQSFFWVTGDRFDEVIAAHARKKGA
jgi:hypothetical protein